MGINWLRVLQVQPLGWISGTFWESGIIFSEQCPCSLVLEHSANRGRGGFKGKNAKGKAIG